MLVRFDDDLGLGRHLFVFPAAPDAAAALGQVDDDPAERAAFAERQATVWNAAHETAHVPTRRSTHLDRVRARFARIPGIDPRLLAPLDDGGSDDVRVPRWFLRALESDVARFEVLQRAGAPVVVVNGRLGELRRTLQRAIALDYTPPPAWDRHPTPDARLLQLATVAGAAPLHLGGLVELQPDALPSDPGVPLMAFSSGASPAGPGHRAARPTWLHGPALQAWLDHLAEDFGLELPTRRALRPLAEQRVARWQEEPSTAPGWLREVAFDPAQVLHDRWTVAWMRRRDALIEGADALLAGGGVLLLEAWASAPP